jgi:BASS family bile acid:Na+ symporter
MTMKKLIGVLKGFQYTAMIIFAVAAGMIFPELFKHWGGVDLRNKYLILVVIQLVMFGMGTHMRLADFRGVASTGKGVLVGLLCHFSIMPLMGVLLTKVFAFDAEIAAGIILIGSCSSGLASNVMVYLARANLVLSVIVTALATLVAPVMTPLLMKLFADTLIDVKFFSMMTEIIKIVIVPISAALLHDYLKNATTAQAKKIHLLAVLAAAWIILVLSNIISIPSIFSIFRELSLQFASAILVGLGYNRLQKHFSHLDTIMPKFSMAGIIYFTLVTTAAGSESLMKVGGLLFIASVIHNAAGYFFGYWISRGVGMDVPSSRTIAFEVGLQNGGMASGIAGSMGKLGTVGLPAAVFSPWMNISGSILANYWKHRPVKTQINES